MFWKVSNIVIMPRYFGSYHPSFLPGGFPGSSSSISASAANAGTLADLSPASFDQEGRPRHFANKDRRQFLLVKEFLTDACSTIQKNQLISDCHSSAVCEAIQ